MKLAIGAALATGLGAIVSTVWIGSMLKEQTIVAQPYEEGLRYDAERQARLTLGWDVSLPRPPAAAGAEPLLFAVADGAGRPVDGASIEVSVGRPDTSRGVRTVSARGDGGGRYVAAVDFPASGPWLVRFDVRRGGERVRVEKLVQVGAEPCDVGAGPCTRVLESGASVTLEIGPRPLHTMRGVVVAAEVRSGGAPVEDAVVRVAFRMKSMDMGPNERALDSQGDGRYGGSAVLVRCPSGRRDWEAEVTVTARGRSPEVARFDLTVAE
jgi:nitrogen fixation protein FixH